MQTLTTVPKHDVNFLYKPQEDEVLKVKKEEKGFSILDFLVIIAAFFVIAFLGYLVLNPDKEGADKRNIHRSADVSSILTSISSYIGESGEIPDSIPVNNNCVGVENEICKIGPYNCKGLVDLSFLAEGENGENKVLSIPADPSSKSVNGTGYYISQDGQGGVTVCAPYAERNVEISFTKSVF